MEFQVQVISDEKINPSSPTPETFREYKFSIFDQFASLEFIHIIYCYLPDGDDDQINIPNSDHLKKSLSEALKLWYPLAGRIVGGKHVECNDEGVSFVEAKANCSIDGFVKNPNPEELKKLVPFEIDVLLAVQMTRFKCGGVSIGFRMSHKIFDAASLFSFVNSWAAVTRGGSDLHRPSFEGPKYFPPRENIGDPAPEYAKEEVVGKVFTFSNSKIADLQNIYSNSAGRPTRIEALSAFLWSRFYSATVTDPDPTQIYILSSTVNLRTRFEHPLPENLIGNIIGSAIVRLSTENGRVIDGGGEIAHKIREAVKGMKGDTMLAQLKRVSFDIMKGTEPLKSGRLLVFVFSSLSRFPWREADFGWGKPIRIGLTPSYSKRVISFLETPEGDGIEAWVTLEEKEMDKFENDLELLKFL